ncbi:MAG: DUF411 domain-containing protein [Chloroflexota bacterium]|nr:DUF411 domain-containing protein [Chloroflexota bacterium]
MEYLENNEYAVQIEDVSDMTGIKERYQVPKNLQSCHTAIVDGYVIEGHVPVEDIERLLAERPDVAGLTVPAMPIGSPGMEVEGYEDQPYDVLTFDSSGHTDIFSSYAP